MSRYIKKIFKIFVVMLLIMLCSAFPSRALEVETHRTINKYLANRNTNLNGFSLHQYLQKQLDLQKGSEEFVNNKMVFDWIGDGGVFEDKPPECNIPYQRSVNHFHNPINNSGFSGVWDTRILSGMSAINWINQPDNTQNCGHYSWADTRLNYYNALTAPDKATRENYFAQTFRGVGQVMHLVQDMSVPEHARNDGHYFMFDYEKYVDANKGIIYSSDVISFAPDSSFPLNLNNLFDTEQYNGTNPDITYNSNIGLSEYTSANFLSPDTMFNKPNIPYPALAQTVLTQTSTGALYLTKKGHGEANGSGEKIEHLASAHWFYNYLPVSYKSLSLTLNDPAVHSEYAAKLIPRAIGYSSQVLQYFFRGQLEVEMGEGNLTVENASNETIAGNSADINSNNNFELYYDNANGQRSPLTDDSGNPIKVKAQTLNSNSSDEQVINYKAPSERVTAFIVVYKGQLGDESNAVIGKFIPIIGGSVWVAGLNLYGSLGTGDDYIISSKQVEVISGKKWIIDVPATPGTEGVYILVATYTTEPPNNQIHLADGSAEYPWWNYFNPGYNYYLVYDANHSDQKYFDFYDNLKKQYPQGVKEVRDSLTQIGTYYFWLDGGEGIGGHDNMYEGIMPVNCYCEQFEVPIMLSKYSFYIYEPGIPGTPEIGHYEDIYTYETIYEINWPIVSEYKKLESPKNAVWASTANSVSFIIDKDGNMFCSGGNIYGQLGIGKEMGGVYLDSSTGEFIPDPDGNDKPNFYSKTFIQVPGNWKQVHTNGYTVWALKTDGTLWVTGYWYPDNINTFKKVDDTVCAGLIGQYIVKEVVDNYELYTISNDNDGLVLSETYPKEDFSSRFLGQTITQYSEAQEGVVPILEGAAIFTFIGGNYYDLLHSFNKTKGTLWSYSHRDLMQEMPGTDWTFTSGCPIRTDGVITNGQTIAIKGSN